MLLETALHLMMRGCFYLSPWHWFDRSCKHQLMIVLRRHILNVLLSLLVAISAQAAAIAHAAPAPSGRMEICAGTGPVMVYVDDTGQPVGDPVYCPDFAASLILGLVGGPFWVGIIPDQVSPYLSKAEEAKFVSSLRSAKQARGPPVRI